MIFSYEHLHITKIYTTAPPTEIHGMNLHDRVPDISKIKFLKIFSYEHAGITEMYASRRPVAT